jgi:PPP family 3-phenylpropionic acid transporter
MVGPAARHSWLFATQFFAFGVMLPFLPAVLTARGLDAAEIGAVLAVGSAVRLLAGPAGGWAADALGAPRLVLALAAAGSAAAALGFVLLAGFLAMLAVHTVLSIAMAPIVPLTDAVTVAGVRHWRLDYARVRAAGSVAFILAALLGGQAVARFGPESAVALMVLGCSGAAAAALLLPRAPVAPVARLRGAAAFFASLRVAAFRWLLVNSALIQASHAFYYAFGTLHWQAAGLGAGLIGALWATGVVAEIVLFVWGRGVVARLGPLGLSVIAAGSGVLRWGGMAMTTDPWLLFPLQVLHAGTYGAQHLAAMQILGRIVPPGQGGTAQAVHAALGPGLAMMLVTLASGPMFQAHAGGGYWAMALLCAAGLPAAVVLGRALRRT